jgi:hypothetical protein
VTDTLGAARVELTTAQRHLQQLDEHTADLAELGAVITADKRDACARQRSRLLTPVGHRLALGHGERRPAAGRRWQRRHYRHECGSGGRVGTGRTPRACARSIRWSERLLAGPLTTLSPRPADI